MNENVEADEAYRATPKISVMSSTPANKQENITINELGTDVDNNKMKVPLSSHTSVTFAQNLIKENSPQEDSGISNNSDDDRNKQLIRSKPSISLSNLQEEEQVSNNNNNNNSKNETDSLKQEQEEKREKGDQEQEDTHKKSNSPRYRSTYMDLLEKRQKEAARLLAVIKKVPENSRDGQKTMEENQEYIEVEVMSFNQIHNPVIVKTPKKCRKLDLSQPRSPSVMLYNVRCDDEFTNGPNNNNNNSNNDNKQKTRVINAISSPTATVISPKHKYTSKNGQTNSMAIANDSPDGTSSSPPHSRKKPLPHESHEFVDSNLRAEKEATVSGAAGFAANDYGIGMHREVKSEDILCACVAYKSREIWVSHRSGELIIRSMEGTVLYGVPITDKITSIYYLDEHIWTGSKEGKLRVFQEETHLQIDMVWKRKHEINVITGVSHALFVGTVDGRVMTWHPKSRQLLDSIKLASAVTKMVYLAVQSVLWVACEDGTINIFTYMYQRANSNNVDKGDNDDDRDNFIIDNNNIINDSGNSNINNNSINPLDLETDVNLMEMRLRGKLIRQIKAHKKSITGLVLSGVNIWSSSLDGTICIWSSINGGLLKVIENDSGIVALTAVLRQVWSLTADKIMNVWDGRTSAMVGEGKNVMGSKMIPVQLIDQATVWVPTNGGRLKIVKLHLPRSPIGMDGTDHYRGEREIELNDELHRIYKQEEQTWKRLRERETVLAEVIKQAATQDAVWQQTVADLEDEIRQKKSWIDNEIQENNTLREKIAQLEGRLGYFDKEIRSNDDKLGAMKNEYEIRYKEREDQLMAGLNRIEKLSVEYYEMMTALSRINQVAKSLRDREVNWNSNLAFIQAGQVSHMDVHHSPVANASVATSMKTMMTFVYCQVDHIDDLRAFLGVDEMRRLLISIHKFFLKHTPQTTTCLVQQIRPDEWLLSFGTAIEAVSWSLRMQELLLSSMQWPDLLIIANNNKNHHHSYDDSSMNNNNAIPNSLKLMFARDGKCIHRGARIAMGIHSCQATSEQENSKDNDHNDSNHINSRFVGSDIHVASDICNLVSEGGQIVISQTVYDYIHEHLSSFGHVSMLPIRTGNYQRIIDQSKYVLQLYEILPSSLFGRVFNNNNAKKTRNKDEEIMDSLESKSGHNVYVERRTTLLQDLKSEYDSLSNSVSKVQRTASNLLKQQEDGKESLRKLRQSLIEIQLRLRHGENPTGLLAAAYVHLDELHQRQSEFMFTLTKQNEEKQTLIGRLEALHQTMLSAGNDAEAERLLRDRLDAISVHLSITRNELTNSESSIQEMKSKHSHVSWQLAAAVKTAGMQSDVITRLEADVERIKKKRNSAKVQRDDYKEKADSYMKKLQWHEKESEQKIAALEGRNYELARKLVEVKSTVSHVIRTHLSKGDISALSDDISAMESTISQTLRKNVPQVFEKMSLGMSVMNPVDIYASKVELAANNANNNANDIVIEEKNISVEKE